MEVQRLTNGVNGSYWLITFTDDRNCWICTKKTPQSWLRLSVLDTAQKSEILLLWKAPEGMQSVSSYLKHDESLAVRWACVNRSSGLNEFRDWTAVFRLSFCSLSSLSLSLYPQSFLLPFLTEQQILLMTDRPASQSESGIYSVGGA